MVHIINLQLLKRIDVLEAQLKNLHQALPMDDDNHSEASSGTHVSDISNYEVAR